MTCSMKRASFRTGCTASAALLCAALAVSGCGGSTGRTSGPPPPVTPADSGATLLGSLAGVTVFPADNWWNLDLSAAPVDPGSDAFIAWIESGHGGNPVSLHPDFGPPPYGIPYAVVSGTQALEPVTFSPYGSQSDAGAPGRPAGYPIPAAARGEANWIEGAVPGGGTGGDRHLLLVDRDHGLLFETWATRWNAAAQRWEAGSGAVFDLGSNARRPEGWTSADAAGLAILPGLVRYDELGGTVAHAYRFTVRATDGHVWPASHTAGSTAGALPMGARLRLKASKDLSGYTPEVRRIFEAMKSHGLVVADNGSDMYVSGTMDARWDNDVLNPAFASLDTRDFEVIELGWTPPGTAVPRSGAAAPVPASRPARSPSGSPR